MSSHRSLDPSRRQPSVPASSSSRSSASSRRLSVPAQRRNRSAAPSSMPSHRGARRSSSPSGPNAPPVPDYRSQDGGALYTQGQMQSEIDRQCRPYRREMDVLTEDYRLSQEALRASESTVVDRDEALARTRARLADADRRLDEMETKIEAKNTEVQRLHDNVADLTRQLRESQREADEVVSGEAHAQMQARIADSRRLREEAEQENERLKATIVEMNAQQGETQRQQIAQMKVFFEQRTQKQKSDAETEAAQLQGQTAQMKQSYEQQAKEKKTAADAEIAALKLQISNLRAGSMKELGALRAAHARDIAAKNQQIADISAAMGREQAIRANEGRDHMQQLMRLNQQLRSAMDERNVNPEQPSLEQQARANQALDATQKERIERQTERKVELKWEKKVVALEKECARLRNDVEELQADLALAQAQKGAAEAEIASLEVKLRRARSELEDGHRAKRLKLEGED